MSDQPRVVVVGGGIAGLATALEAVTMGVTEVTVVERASLASASSGLTIGLFSRSHPTAEGIRWRSYAFERYSEMERAGLLQMSHQGYLRLARSEAAVSGLEQQRAALNAAGMDEVDILGPDGLAALVPTFNFDGVIAGMHTRGGDGAVDGHTACAAHAQRATGLGVKIRQNCEVRGFDRRADRIVVETSQGDLECDVVVNAAGAWAPEIGKKLGAQFPGVNQRHQIGTVKLAQPLGHDIPVITDYVSFEAGGLYLSPDGDKQWVAGLFGMEQVVEDPDDYPHGTSAEFEERLAQFLVERFPDVEMGFGSGWSGLFPATPDGAPVVGRYPGVEGVVVAAGGGASGMQLGPMIGRLAAEAIVHGQPTSADPEPYAPNRFDQ